MPLLPGIQIRGLGLTVVVPVALICQVWQPVHKPGCETGNQRELAIQRMPGFVTIKVFDRVGPINGLMLSSRTHFSVARAPTRSCGRPVSSGSTTNCDRSTPTGPTAGDCGRGIRVLVQQGMYEQGYLPCCRIDFNSEIRNQCKYLRIAWAVASDQNQGLQTQDF
jgi:hypothetical protein